MRVTTTASHAQLNGGIGAGGADGGGLDRTPQSVQSVPRVQSVYSAPGPPSSHAPSPGQAQVLVHRSPATAPATRGRPTSRSVATKLLSNGWLTCAHHQQWQQQARLAGV